MKKTAIEELINFIKSTSDINLILKKGEELKNVEEAQIFDAFNEGMKYGNSLFQTFDYPASRYFYYTYKNPTNEK